MQKRQRRSIRLPKHDYSSPGAYYITLVTFNREHLFGEIVDGKMKINDMGFLVKNEWQRLTSRFPNIELDEFVVMPNHMHGIICIVDSAIGVRARPNSVGARQREDSMSGNPVCASPLPDDSSPRQDDASPRQDALGNIVGAFKSTTARLINGIRHTPGNPVWQRNYYEHIIRNPDEWERIRAYIQTNPTNWQLDHENPLKAG